MRVRARPVLGAAAVALVTGVVTIGIAFGPPEAGGWLLIAAVPAVILTIQAAGSDPRDLIPAVLLGLFPVLALLLDGSPAWLIGPLAACLLLACELAALSWECQGERGLSPARRRRLLAAIRLGAIAAAAGLAIGLIGATGVRAGTALVLGSMAALAGMGAVLFGRVGPHRRLLGLLTATLVLGCGTEDSAPDTGVPVEPSAADVRIVATPQELARVLDVQPDGEGRIWVLNSLEPFFLVLAPDGRVDRAFGRAGGGPAEYGAPVALVRGPGEGEVWTYDVPRQSLRRIAPEEGPALRLPTDRLAPPRIVSFQGAGFRPAPPWMASAPEGILMASGRPSTSPWTGSRLWQADIFLVRTDSPSVVVEPGTRVADLLGDPESRYPGATTFLPYPIWAVCPDGGLALYDPLQNSLRRFDKGGREREAVALPPERRIAMTFDRAFGMFYRQMREAGSSQVPDSAQLRATFEAQVFPPLAGSSADVFPEYADLRCDGEGTLWLSPFETASARYGHGSEWWRIDEDGSRTIYRLPEAFTAFRFGEDRVWGAVVDSLGIPSVASIRIRP